MTTDLRTQIRGYFDEINPPFEPDQLMAHPAADRISDGLASGFRWQRFPGWVYAAATTAIVLLVVGGAIWLSSFLGEETPPVIEQPAPTVTSTSITSTSVPEETDGPIAAHASNFINQVRDLAVATNGTVWAATRGGVVEWPAGASSPVVYGQEDGLPGVVVDLIVVATDGTVWAAGDGWVAYLDQSWHSVEAEDPSSETMVADPTGGVWTTATGRDGAEVLLHIDRNGAERIRVPEGMGWFGRLAITVDATGRVWTVDRFWPVEVFDTHPVFVYDAGTWSEVTTTEPFFNHVPRPTSPGDPPYFVSNIEIAPDGTVWISAYGMRDPETEGPPPPGVASLSGRTWTTHTTADGLASDDGAVTIGADGTVWVIHDDAVSRRDGETWVVQDVAGSPRAAVGGSDGTLWLGTDNGIVHLDGATATASAVPPEMAPAVLPFRLEPAAPAGAPFDAGSFGEVAWQRFTVPTAHSLIGGIDTANGFAAISDGAVRATVEGLNWMPSQPPLEAWRLVASGDDLYALGEGAVRLAWTGTTWEIVDELSIPDPEPEIRSEPGYLRSVESIAFGDGVTVLTAGSQVFFSTDGHTFVPAIRGPDPGSIFGVFSTGNGFVAFTSEYGWSNFGLIRPIVWTSEDGSTWDLVSSDSPFDSNGGVYDIAEHDGRFVAVRGRGLWVSDDGLTWSEIAPEHINGSITSRPLAIAAGEAGWVALFGEAGTQGEVRAVYSPDGLEWVVDTDPIPELTWAFGTPDVAVGTDRILVTYFMDAYIGEIAR